MKIGERGQVTIPRQLRERFGLKPSTEVEFEVVSDKLVLKKVGKPLNLRKWIGKGGGGLKKMGYKNVDDYIRDIRGR
jgi:AbrB family looped-hinge helix DNA binding protein